MTTQAKDIQDRLFDLVTSLSQFKTVRRTPIRQLQPEDTPSATVLRGEEDWSPDGDANAGEPHFIHEARFTIAVVRGFAPAADLDTAIDADMDAVENLVLRDTELLLLFEGITSVRRTITWPQAEDAYYVEAMFEITVEYRTRWEPIVPNDFLQFDLKTTAPHAGVEVLIDLPQS